MEAASQLAPTSLSGQIRTAREAANLTQAELAAFIGCSVRSLQGWEAGRTPRPRYRRALATFLNGNEAVA